MNYKKPVALSELIAWSFIVSDAKYLASINGHDLPETFRAIFFLKDKEKAFRTDLEIQIVNEKPFLLELKVSFVDGRPWQSFARLEKEGIGKAGDISNFRQTYTDGSGDKPVQAKHLNLVAKFHYQLIQKAIALAITTEANKNKNTYLSSEIDEIEQALAKTLKRNVPTDSMLRDVAKRYKKAEKAGDPLYDDIMRHYSISERRTRELLRMCRKHVDKLLPKRKAGRPSVNPTPTRKKGK
jgi:hypothetical protein